jgi:hypothetical protein
MSTTPDFNVALKSRRIQYYWKTGRCVSSGPSGPDKHFDEELSRILSEAVPREIQPKMGTPLRKVAATRALHALMAWLRDNPWKPTTLFELRVAVRKYNLRPGTVFPQPSPVRLMSEPSEVAAWRGRPSGGVPAGAAAPRGYSPVVPARLLADERVSQGLDPFLAPKRSERVRFPATLLKEHTKRRNPGLPRFDPSEWHLSGRLLGVYLNAVKRGYLGGPSRWIRAGRTPRKCSEWHPRISVFDRNPLLYVVWPHKQADAWLSTRQCRAIHQSKIDVPIRTRPYSVVEGRRNRSRTGPERALPSLVPALRFPSSPTISEWWRFVLGTGKPYPGRNGRVRDFVSTWPCWTRGTLGANRSLVRQFIIGIRDDIVVPRKILPWFRRMRGFLIPSPRLPAKLVGFLLSTWRADQSSVCTRFGHWSFSEALKVLHDVPRTKEESELCSQILRPRGTRRARARRKRRKTRPVVD